METYMPLLKNTNMFLGIRDSEIRTMLKCLSTKKIRFQKGEYIIRSGENNHLVGLVLSGLVLIEKVDHWGTNSIFEEITPGMTFAESYACVSMLPAEINVLASTDAEVMFLDFRRIFTVCSSACVYHTKLIYNLLNAMAQKNISLTQKIEHLSKRTIRDRLLSYLSTESMKANSSSFEIPFNRQQLASYLAVDRSALCSEISKLQKEGIITCHKNRFQFNGHAHRHSS